MTDRIQRVTVILDRDYRTDDVEPILAALGMVKGVLAVEPGEPLGIQDYTARATVFSELYRVIDAVLREARSNSDVYKEIRALLKKEDL